MNMPASWRDDIAERLSQAQSAGFLTGLHAVVVRQNGEDVLDYYAQGADWAWGQNLGDVNHGPSVLHDLRSVTKSIVGLLYGIALNRAAVLPPEAPLALGLPDYAALIDSAGLGPLTIGHALNMTLGLEWNEDLPYTDPRNSEIGMEMSDDRCRFVLSQPVEAAPGAQYRYSGGAAALVGAVVAQGTGQPLNQFAQEGLFDPLGIEEVAWHRGRDGSPSAASGLRMTAPDLARIGEMLANDGAWGGQQVVPTDWLARLRAPVTTTDFGAGYSHLWNLLSEDVPAINESVSVMAALGNGGQRLYVLPKLGLSVAMLAGSYNAPDQWLTPTLVLRRGILASLKALTVSHET